MELAHSQSCPERFIELLIKKEMKKTVRFFHGDFGLLNKYQMVIIMLYK